MEHLDTQHKEPQTETEATVLVLPIYINRPLITDDDLAHAEAQEQAA